MHDLQKRFLALSEILTGCDNLASDLADEFLLLIQQEEEITPPLDAFDKEGATLGAAIKLSADATWHPAIRRIILLWLTGELVDRDGKIKTTAQSHHFRGLMWDSLHAHPPAPSGGYFGY